MELFPGVGRREAAPTPKGRYRPDFVLSTHYPGPHSGYVWITPRTCINDSLRCGAYGAVLAMACHEM